jgi:uncharacterized protein
MSIIYLEPSALLKLYVQEKFTDEVHALLESADVAGASILTYAEMAAAMRRAARMDLIADSEARAAWVAFDHDWPEYMRLKISTPLVERAASLAWEFGLRGYDAVHLAAAMTWQDALETPVILATFDRLLWDAAQKSGMATWPTIRP